MEDRAAIDGQAILEICSRDGQAILEDHAAGTARRSWKIMQQGRPGDPGGSCSRDGQAILEIMQQGRPGDPGGSCSQRRPGGPIESPARALRAK